MKGFWYFEKQLVGYVSSKAYWKRNNKFWYERELLFAG